MPDKSAETLDPSKILADIENAYKGTNRGFNDYKESLGLTVDYLKGKEILDVGAGGSDFAKVATEHGAHVINLDPDYSKEPPKDSIDAVTAIAQNIPFQDDKFDDVIAMFSLYRVNEGLDQSLKEMLRVVKPGGKVRIFPALKMPSNGTLPDSISSNGTRLEITKPSSKESLDSLVQTILSNFALNEAVENSLAKDQTKDEDQEFLNEKVGSIESPLEGNVTGVYSQNIASAILTLGSIWSGVDILGFTKAGGSYVDKDGITKTVPEGHEYIQLGNVDNLRVFWDKVSLVYKKSLPHEVEGSGDTSEASSDTVPKPITENNEELQATIQRLNDELRSMRSGKLRDLDFVLGLRQEIEDLKEQIRTQEDQMRRQGLPGKDNNFSNNGETVQSDYALVGLSPSMFAGLDNVRVIQLIDRTRKYLSNIYHPESRLLPDEHKMSQINAALDRLSQKYK